MHAILTEALGIRAGEHGDALYADRHGHRRRPETREFVATVVGRYSMPA